MKKDNEHFFVCMCVCVCVFCIEILLLSVVVAKAWTELLSRMRVDLRSFFPVFLYWTAISEDDARAKSKCNINMHCTL